jgi:hypothetical protein
MNFDWKSLLRTVAPALATAAGGPLAGLAVKTIGDALGLDNATEDTVSAALQGASPDTLLKLKQADQQFAKDMKALDVDLEKVAAADRDSARRMQVETKSRTPHVLAVIVTVGFFSILIGMMGGWLKPSENQALLILLGALSAAFGAVINFFYGSSAGSQAKDATIKAMAK